MSIRSDRKENKWKAGIKTSEERHNKYPRTARPWNTFLKSEDTNYRTFCAGWLNSYPRLVDINRVGKYLHCCKKCGRGMSKKHLHNGVCNRCG